MSDDDLITAVKESVTGVRMTIPAEQIVRRSRVIRTRRRVPVLAAAMTVMGAAVFAAAVLLPAHQAGGGPTATPWLRARLLAAIDAARGDILSAQVWLSGQGGSEQTLTFPWYPRPGQQVRIHTRGWGADGRLGKDAESIFRMPAGHGSSSFAPLGAGLNVTGTFIAVFPAKHTWGRWHHLSLTLGLSADAAGIRRQLAKGQLKIIRRGVLHGHKAIELGLVLPSGHGPGLHVTAARLWVNAATYLPMRQVLRFSDGKQDMTDYRFLSPTAANLAKLRPVVPSGYHRTTLLPDQRPYK